MIYLLILFSCLRLEICCRTKTASIWTATTGRYSDYLIVTVKNLSAQFKFTVQQQIRFAVIRKPGNKQGKQQDQYIPEHCRINQVILQKCTRESGHAPRDQRLGSCCRQSSYHDPNDTVTIKKNSQNPFHLCFLSMDFFKRFFKTINTLS